MVEPMSLCSFLFSAMIVGAYEIKPGIMQVQLLNANTNSTEELYVHTSDYLGCWDDLPVRRDTAID